MQFMVSKIIVISGKTMENERKRVDVQLANKWNGRYGAEALISKPNFHSYYVIDETLVVIKLNRTTINIRKPFMLDWLLWSFWKFAFTNSIMV